ncbi:MAG TPA: dihydrodipicolinate synthase family protein [Vicinamibacterales bacterium]|jgi:4-hydroxy-tetrahydrodipicolinate synthase|nr:dihydrodipicolinate synthase family protein [Vicinamibacterales bacterium]
MTRREALTRLGAGAAVAIGGRAVAVADVPRTRDTERRHFDGIALFAITPMRLRDGRADVDFDGFERNMRFYVGHDGAYSLAVCGAVGEYHVLTPEERSRLIGIAAAVKGKRLLVAGAGGDTTPEAIANVQAAAKAGADAAVLLPSEAVGKGGDSALVTHYLEIARAVDIGVIPYRAPVTRFNVDTVVRLLDHPRILAVKEQTGDLRFIRDAAVRTNGRMPLVPAHERMAPFSHLAGATGITSGHANFAPTRSMELWQQLRSGRTQEAMALADRFAQLDTLRATYGDVLIKAGLELRGLAGGPLRKDKEALPAEGRQALERIMREMGVLEGTTR